MSREFQSLLQQVYCLKTIIMQSQLEKSREHLEKCLSVFQTRTDMHT